MAELLSLPQFDAAANFIRSRSEYRPEVALILGSGLGSLAEAVEKSEIIDYHEIPFWPVSTVAGHSGQLVLGALENKQVMMLQGRAHYYEGYTMSQVTFPIRVMQRLGIKMVIVTNAAGAINPAYSPGDLMLINDHIGLIGMAGLNPLIGPNLDQLGPRFPDMSQAYDRNLLALARQVSQEEHLRCHEGVYVGLSGPSFETPADLRFLRSIGSDAVGMSTVPEVIVARHGGMRVLGISGISNKANLDGNTITTHEEVLQAGRSIVPGLTTLIRRVLQRIS
jgi:purine-nucleoside phosphorylase